MALGKNWYHKHYLGGTRAQFRSIIIEDFLMANSGAISELRIETTIGVFSKEKQSHDKMIRWMPTWV